MGITQHRCGTQTCSSSPTCSVARQYRSPGRRPVSGARSFQRPGRPHRRHHRNAETGVPRSARTPIRLQAAGGARPQRRDRAGGDAARRSARYSSRWAAISPPRYRTGKRHAAALRNLDLTVHDLNQAQPQPSRPRAGSSDPAVPRPHRNRHPGDRSAVDHRRGFNVDGACLRRPQPCPPPSICVANRRSSRAWRARRSARSPRSIGKT